MFVILTRSYWFLLVFTISRTHQSASNQRFIVSSCPHSTHDELVLIDYAIRILAHTYGSISNIKVHQRKNSLLFFILHSKSTTVKYMSKDIKEYCYDNISFFKFLCIHIDEIILHRGLQKIRPNCCTLLYRHRCLLCSNDSFLRSQ